jgi:hypothetical protein
MLPVLAYYFHISKGITITHKHREQIDRWFWRVAFAERYSTGSQTKMTEDAGWLRNLIVSTATYDKPVTANVNSLVESSMTYTAAAARNAILCLLMLQGPLHFKNASRLSFTGEHFAKFNVAERHHIFPVSFLKKLGFRSDEVHRIPNFCFLPVDVNQWIGDRPPSEYMRELRDEVGVEQTSSLQMITLGCGTTIMNDF